jgi:hypothetical protein
MAINTGMQTGDKVRRISTGKEYYVKYRSGSNRLGAVMVTNASLFGVTITVPKNDLEVIEKSKGN